jgi:hypothetical protein
MGNVFLKFQWTVLRCLNVIGFRHCYACFTKPTDTLTLKSLKQQLLAGSMEVIHSLPFVTHTGSIQPTEEPDSWRKSGWLHYWAPTHQTACTSLLVPFQGQGVGELIV